MKKATFIFIISLIAFRSFSGNLNHPVEVKTGPMMSVEVEDSQFPDLKKNARLYHSGFHYRWGSIPSLYSNKSFSRKLNKNLKLESSTTKFHVYKKCEVWMAVSNHWTKPESDDEKKKKKKRKKKDKNDAFGMKTSIISEFDKKDLKKTMAFGQESFISSKEFKRDGWKEITLKKVPEYYYRLYQSDGFKWIVYKKKCKTGRTYSYRTDKRRAPILLMPRNYGKVYPSKFVRFKKDKKLFKENSDEKILADLKGAFFSQHQDRNLSSATTYFKILKDCYLCLAVTDRWTENASRKAIWKKECISAKKLIKEGWHELENLNFTQSNGIKRLVFGRRCSRGEKFCYRTEQVYPPIIIIPGENDWNQKGDLVGIGNLGVSSNKGELDPLDGRGGGYRPGSGAARPSSSTSTNNRDVDTGKDGTDTLH